MVDFSSLAQPVADQPPCGPDCEYESDFVALSQAVVGKSEQQFGNTVIPAVAPEWRSVEQMATGLLARTKDLRVAGLLTLAATHLHGVSGFAAGVDLMLKLCEQYWDDVHPRMVIDGDEDPYLRINALAALSDGSGGYSEGSEIMRAVRAQALVSHPLTILVRDVAMTAAKDAAAQYSDAQIQTILSDALKSNSATIIAFEQVRASVKSLSDLIDERFGSGESPDLSALKSLCKIVGVVIDRAKPASGVVFDDGGSQGIGDETFAGSGGSSLQGATGEIRSREDVRRTLQRVCEYLERHEPSNPAVLFARRAQNMLDRNFLDIMLELSPDSVQHLQMLTGAKLPDAQE